MVRYILTEKQLNLLFESYEDLTFHKGDELDINKPYISDTIVRMDGRGTGHFGSGTYFSSYPDEKINVNIDLTKDNPIKKIDGGLWVTNLSFYNLYIPNSREHAELLFDTLKTINRLFSVHWSDFEVDSFTKEKLLKIKTNCNKLGLKSPTLKEFISLVKDIRKNYKEGTLQHYGSLSTRFMEYNGYNGVNVNGIPGFDNTLHGTVIYDLSKTIEPKETKEFNKFNRYYENNLSNIIDKINKRGYLSLEKELNRKEINFIFNTVTSYLPFRNINYNIDSGKINNSDYDYIRNFIYPKYINRLNSEGVNFKFSDDDIDLIIDNIKKFDFIYGDEDLIYKILSRLQFYYDKFNKENVNYFLSKINTDDKFLLDYIDEIKRNLI